MTTYVRNGTHHTAEVTNLTEQHVADDRHESLLWAIVGQACEDATSLKAEPVRDSDCVWGRDEAMLWLTQTLGEEHRITRRVAHLRANGKRVKVNVHSQDGHREAK